MFCAANARFGFRLIHYSVQGNHIHLLVEAEGTRALSRGMQGLNVRMAIALNRLMRRRGKVLADRYHAVVLRTPTQTARARHYVLHNRQHHAPGRYAADWRDPFASAEAPLVEPRTWLLRREEVGEQFGDAGGLVAEEHVAGGGDDFAAGAFDGRAARAAVAEAVFGLGRLHY